MTSTADRFTPPAELSPTAPCEGWNVDCSVTGELMAVPFNLHMYDEVVFRYLCEDCAHESSRDV